MTNKRTIVIIARTSEEVDMAFYKAVLRQDSPLLHKAVIVLFSTVHQFIDFINSMPDEYCFSLLIHVGSWTMTKGQDGNDIAKEIKKTFPNIQFEYTSRDGDSLLNGIKVHHTSNLPDEFDVNSLSLINIGNIRHTKSNEGSAKELISPDISIAIMTALFKDEHEAFDENMESSEIKLDKNLKRGSFKDLKDFEEKEHFLITWQDKMGSIDAAAFASRLITKHSPRFLILGGVCGGLETGAGLYDVIIPATINDYVSGKFEDGKFLPTPIPCPVNEDLINHLIANDRVIKENMRKIAPKIYHNIIDNGTFKIHFKDMACGPWVIKTTGVLENIANEINANIKGLEMESLGVVRASNIFHKYGQYALVVKSVMDFTDINKTDGDKGQIKTIASNISYLCIRALFPILKQFDDKKL